MHFSTFSLLPLLALADVALSICPGFNYAVGNLQYSPDSHYDVWRVYDDSCKQHDVLSIPGTPGWNPCFQGMFGCSPPPIHFNTYKDSHTGLIYNCRPDPNSGSCQNDFGTDIISVCCRNDGH
ncbi:hypothetical protein BDN72DRAFT_507247 [Pluteus cervinus]|uniref:Uncharacterized protein n=1 Tax=Pluteus cervinus TaxID=181527 RepID=A0ACD3A450_9AGAR|nr:hypothetical protein BDN72DRAFT_507247 [Pluteus cervinus]